jgi:hypothetical protein
MARDWRARALQSFGQIAGNAETEGLMPTRFDIALTAVRPPVLLGILVLSMSAIAGQTYNPFIYFQF